MITLKPCLIIFEPCLIVLKTCPILPKPWFDIAQALAPYCPNRGFLKITILGRSFRPAWSVRRWAPMEQICIGVGIVDQKIVNARANL